MRRRDRAQDTRPGHLAHFRESDWPGASWEARWRAWRDAGRAHLAEHGWPGGPLDLFMRHLYARDPDARQYPGVVHYFTQPGRVPPTVTPSRRR